MGACSSTNRARFFRDRIGLDAPKKQDSDKNKSTCIDRDEAESEDDSSSIRTTAGGSEGSEPEEVNQRALHKPMSELELYEADLTERDLTLREKEVDLLEFDEDLVQRDVRIRQLEAEFAAKIKALRKLEKQLRRREARVVEREERLFAIPVAEVVAEANGALVMT